MIPLPPVTRRLLPVTAWILLATAILPATPPAVVLEFLPATQVSSNRITVGDLARIHCQDPAISDRLARIDIGYAPNPGLTRVIQRGLILQKIRSRDESVFQVTGAEVVAVRREATTVDENALKTALTNWLGSRWQVAADAITIKRLYFPGNVFLPPGPQSFEFQPVEEGNATECTVHSESYETSFHLGYTFSVRARILTARKDLPFGHHPSREDVQLEEKTLDRSPWDYARLPEQLAQVTLAEALHAGAPVALHSLRKATVIKRGDIVTIAYRDEQLKITATGKALQSGHVGRIIEVRNNSSGRVITARIISPGQVQVSNAR